MTNENKHKQTTQMECSHMAGGGTVASRGDMSIRADHLANRNANLTFGMEESGWEQAEPDRVRFNAGGQTYNVLRSRLSPWEIGQEGNRTGPGALAIHYIVHPELYGKEQELPLVKYRKGFGWRRHYTTWDSPDWQLPGVKTLGITPPSAPPPEGTPAYDVWQAEYDAKLRELEEKIPAYNDRIHEANRRIEFEDYYLYVSKQKTIAPTLLSTAPGTIQSGGDLLLDTDTLNKDSAIQAGGTLKAAAGNLSNISTAVKSETLRWNTVTFSEVVCVAMGAKHSRHNHPQDEYEAPALSDAHLPTVIAKDHASPAISAVTAPSMKDLTIKADAGHTQTLTGQISRNIPNTSIYKINKETTATYLIETDPAFTDRKKFLSSDYMYEQMKWDPDKTMKRLGDGFYEQELVRQQIMELKGTRYLPGYTGDEEEYKALMESGAAFARKYDLKPGIELTKEQMAALTGDIVWLIREKVVLPGGKTEDVLIPRVYLKAGSRKELRPDGSLISASRIVMDLKQDLENSGTMQGKDGISIKAGTINGHGNFTGGHIDLDTQKDMALHGILAAEKSVKLASGGNMDISSETYRTADKNGSYRTGMAKTAGIAVKNKEGLLLLSAKNDLFLSGAELKQLGEKGASLLQAGRDVRIGAVHTDNYAQGITDSDNYLKDRTIKDEGTVLVGKGNVQIGAGRDITAKAAYAESKDGSIRMAAGRDIALTAGEESSRHELGLKYKESGVLSGRQTTMKEDTAIEKPEGSLISGKEVQLAAGRNIALQASAAAGENDVTLTAGNDITADSAAQKTRNMDYRQVKKSGFIGSGLGLTIGSEKEKDSYDTEETMQAGSTVGSVKGSVTIHAQNNITVRASDIIAGKDTLITGRNVDIESKDNTYRGKEEHEYKKSGLTVSLGGAVITAKDNIIRPIKNAGQVRDGLLGKLYAADAGFNLHDAVKTYKNIGNMKKGITLDVSVGSRSAKSDSRYQGTEAKESRIVSQGNIRIKSDENIAVKGSQITGENVTLQAGKDIHLTAAENRKTTEGNSRSKGAGITASFGIGGLQNVGISAGKSKGNMEEEIMTHTGSTVTAKETLAMESGENVTITGSKAGGKNVEIKAGNNLSIESLQDSHTYHSRDKESGIHLQRDITARQDTGKKKMDDPYFSIGKKTDTTDSTYESVTKQAGIYAGKEGYDIQVKNNTRLKGAVIDSQAPAEKNKLTTGTLTWENIENKAEYKTGGYGISYNGKIGGGDKNDPLDSRTNNRYGKDAITGQRNGMNKITPTIYGSKIPLNERGLLNTPIPSVKGTAGTTTRSAVSKGTITITDKENQKQDIEKLNRNTEDSLNKLKEIFDKTKVEERKRLLEELGIVGNQAIHTIASHNGWKDGSAEKVALHGMLGAITSAKSGGSALSGLIAGGANEYAIGYLEKSKGKDWINKHPDTVQNISAAFGGILSKMTGGSGHTGAYISQIGTKWNEYLTAEEIAEIMFDDGRAEEYLKLKGEPATEENIEKLKTDLIDIVKENKDADAIIMTANAGSIVGGEFDYIYDIKTQDGKSYISAGTSIGASTSPLGFSISVVKFVPLVQGIDLSDEKVRQDILSGVTFTGSVFAGIGVGAQIPIYSDYAGKVAIYLIGIGTPSVGGGIGNSESVDDKKAKIERDIQDNLYGLD